jgi:SAM-dependent methyltransferase
MQIPKPIRAAARRILGPQAGKRWRGYFRRKARDHDWYQATLAGQHGLELGGPSELFADEGSLPIYQSLASLDNCLYSARTIWTGDVKTGASFAYHPLKQVGNQIIAEANDLGSIQDASYECVLASHCLEHVANPLRALLEWRRVLKSNGLLLLVLPHKDGTFDWRRPITTLDHMISDYESNVGEDDLTHLPEILALHDLRRDKAAGTVEQFRERCMDNYSKRAMHHHVFETGTAVRLLDYCNLQIVRVDNLKPYHIIILARKCDSQPNNSDFLGGNAVYRRTSPFDSDRLPVGSVRES